MFGWVGRCGCCNCLVGLVGVAVISVWLGGCGCCKCPPWVHVIVMYSDVSEHDNTTLQTETHACIHCSSRQPMDLINIISYIIKVKTFSLLNQF